MSKLPLYTIPIWVALSFLVRTTAHTADDFPDESAYLSEPPVVLSASRLEQPRNEAPVTITVIDRAAIEASGARHIQDLFRLVPGYQVGHLRGHELVVGYIIDWMGIFERGPTLRPIQKRPGEHSPGPTQRGRCLRISLPPSRALLRRRSLTQRPRHARVVLHSKQEPWLISLCGTMVSSQYLCNAAGKAGRIGNVQELIGSVGIGSGSQHTRNEELRAWKLFAQHGHERNRPAFAHHDCRFTEHR